MAKKVDHVAVAVRSIEESLRFYRDLLGLEHIGDEEVAEQKVRVAVLRAGETRVELLEPTASDSPVARFIATKGEGLHHIAFRVDGIEGELERLAAHGTRLIDAQPRVGAEGARIGFIHPAASSGVLIELVER